MLRLYHRLRLAVVIGMILFLGGFSATLTVLAQGQPQEEELAAEWVSGEGTGIGIEFPISFITGISSLVLQDLTDCGSGEKIDPKTAAAAFVFSTTAVSPYAYEDLEKIIVKAEGYPAVEIVGFDKIQSGFGPYQFTMLAPTQWSLCLEPSMNDVFEIPRLRLAEACDMVYLQQQADSGCTYPDFKLAYPRGTGWPDGSKHEEDGLECHLVNKWEQGEDWKTRPNDTCCCTHKLRVTVEYWQVETIFYLDHDRIWFNYKMECSGPGCTVTLKEITNKHILTTSEGSAWDAVLKLVMDAIKEALPGIGKSIIESLKKELGLE